MKITDISYSIFIDVELPEFGDCDSVRMYWVGGDFKCWSHNHEYFDYFINSIEDCLEEFSECKKLYPNLSPQIQKITSTTEFVDIEPPLRNE